MVEMAPSTTTESIGSILEDLPSKSGPRGQIIVIKVGTSSLVNPEEQRFNLSALARIVETVKALHAMGHYVIIVTSGAVGVGCHRLGLAQRPTSMAQKQALAAVGQGHLMKFYEDFLTTVGLTCAQVLVTLESLAVRGQYNNVRNTFTELLAYGVIPVVNENDSTSIQKLRFGDNDTLSAHVAALVQANWLFLMTDVDYLYTANPKTDATAKPIYEVHDMEELHADTSEGEGTQWGTGGMATKLTAGRIATAAGTTMVICNSNKPEAIVKVVEGAELLGTKFHPVPNALKGRKRWILSVPVRGQLWLDAKACHGVRDDCKSLFCEGIVKVEGNFHVQDAVQLCDEDGVEFARGLINFSLSELMQKLAVAKLSRSVSQSEACPMPSLDIEEVLHSDNITLIATEEDAGDGSTVEGSHSSGFHSEDISQGQLLWLEKMATEADAARVQKQLQELSVCSGPGGVHEHLHEIHAAHLSEMHACTTGHARDLSS